MPTIKPQQTLLDMTAQYAGTLEQLMVVAAGNDKSITETLIPGNSLNITAIDLFVTKYFSSRPEIDIITILPIETIPPGGIGFMQIGGNFIVS